MENHDRFKALSGKILKLWRDGYMHSPGANRVGDVGSDGFLYVLVKSTRIEGHRGFVELVYKRRSGTICVGEREVFEYGGENGDFRAKCEKISPVEKLYMDGSREKYKELDVDLELARLGAGRIGGGF